MSPTGAVEIGAPIDEVWDYLTAGTYNWSHWWGQDIRKLDPGWEKGAELQFSGSYEPILVINELIPNETIQFSMPYDTHINIRLKELGDSSTEVEMEMTLPGGHIGEKLERLRVALE